MKTNNPFVWLHHLYGSVSSWGTCCFSCCPLARSERMGQTMALPVTGEKWSYCNPVSIPVNRRPVLS